MDEEPWDAPLREREQWLEDQTNPPELSLTALRSERSPSRRARQAAARRVLGCPVPSMSPNAVPGELPGSRPGMGFVGVSRPGWNARERWGWDTA